MDNKTNLRNAIVDLAKSLESVFKKYSRQTRIKAWSRMTSKAGEKEIKKILNDPDRPINTFQKLATESSSVRLKIWLDDIRPMPQDFNLHVQTVAEAIDKLKTNHVVLISLDHDLGDYDTKTGYDVAKFIEESAFDGSLIPLEIRIHSANPIGVNNMKMCINNAYKFWGLR